MANTVFSYEQCIFGVPDEFNFTKDFQRRENIGSQNQYCGTEAWNKSVDALYADFGFYQDNIGEEEFPSSKYQQQQQQQQQQSFSEYGLFDDGHFKIASPPMQQDLDEITKLGQTPEIPESVEPIKEKKKPSNFASLELLNSHGNGFKRLNGDTSSQKPSSDIPCHDADSGELSAGDIMRMAGEKFIQSNSQGVNDLSSYSHLYSYYFSGLSEEVIKDIDLAGSLLSAAEKVGIQEYERAYKSLNQCDFLSSQNGSPIQKVVYYFSGALREKIARENGTINASKGVENRMTYDLDETMDGNRPVILACHQRTPFSQVSQFAGIQAIVENVAEAKKVHVIDFGIRIGMQWTVLMQALAAQHECPLELLKITAVGTTSEHKIEDTGNKLGSFAQSLNIPFSFKIVMVEDMQHLKKSLFELEDDEATVVYMPFLLRTMLKQPTHLDHLMGVIRTISPCIVVVCEVEANHNSPTFVDRFIEALFFYSAYFDSIAASMELKDPNRQFIESICFGEAIRNIVAYEGKERKIRHVKINVWRAYFARFGLMEAELSASSIYQASLVVKQFTCGSSCMLDMDGKSLIIGWKGTPLHSLSAWKFQ